jgi:hypothetical protein
MSFAVIAVVGISTAVSIGTTVYQAKEARKAQAKADEEQKRQELQAELETKQVKSELIKSKDEAKFEETKDVGTGTSLTDLFVGGSAGKKTTTGLSGTSAIQNTLGV